MFLLTCTHGFIILKIYWLLVCDFLILIIDMSLYRLFSFLFILHTHIIYLNFYKFVRSCSITILQFCFIFKVIRPVLSISGYRDFPCSFYMLNISFVSVPNTFNNIFLDRLQKKSLKWQTTLQYSFLHMSLQLYSVFFIFHCAINLFLNSYELFA